MTDLLILTAIDMEARALARRLGLSPVLDVPWPHFRSGAIELACIGLRASALSARAGAFRRPKLVISAGACGALSPTLAEGALVVPERILRDDGRDEPAAPLPGLEARGALLSVATAVASGGDKSRLWIETGAIACDMESAAILAWARGQGIAGAVVRGVSDTAEHGVPADLAAVVTDDGHVRTVQAVRAALRRRGALREALALRRGTNAALGTVAAALARITRA